MGNPIKMSSSVEELVSKLKIYENMLETYHNIENKDKLFKIREIDRKIQELIKEIEDILLCEERNDFSLTEEERSFYMQRFILLNIMSNLI